MSVLHDMVPYEGRTNVAYQNRARLLFRYEQYIDEDERGALVE